MPPSAEAPRAPAPLPPWQLFVGRARELQELAAVADDLRRGRGRLVLVTGEAGIGKTRLAEETALRAAAAGARVIWGQCWEAGGAPAYWPWSQVLRRLASAGGDAAWQAWGAGLGEALAPLAPEPTAPDAPRGDAEAARFAAFDAAARLLRRAATDQPLLVVLEDLHAADLPSLLLLEFIAGELDDVPLAVIGTHRPVDAEQRGAVGTALGRLARAALRVPLAGLTAADVAALIAAGGGAAPVDLVTAVHDATAGNPLFVVETARALHVAHPAGLADLPREQLRITGGVRDALRPRLALLGPDGRALLELAAVFGDQADLADLQLASGAPLAAVRDAVREGLAAGVLADTAAAAHGVAFRHALLRDVLYDDLPPPRRRALHRAAGDALAQRHAADPGPHLAALAHHFREGAADAATLARALAYTEQAARRAAALCADEEAATAYRQALDLLARQAPADTARRGLLQVELGEALTRLGEHEDARGALRAAAATARARGDGALLGRAALGCAERDMGIPHRGADAEVVALCEEALAILPPTDSALRVRLQARAAVERALGDDPDRTVATCAAAVAMARRLGDQTALAHALSAHHFALWRLDLPGDRLAMASEIVAIGTAAGDDELVAQGRTWRLYDHMRAGDAVRVDEEIAALSELAERLRRPRYRWIASNARAMRALWQGRFADAEAEIEAALAFANRIEDPAMRLNPSIQLFVLRREQGRIGEQELPTRLAAARFPDSPVPQTFFALLCVELGRLDEARAAFAALAAHDFEDLRRERRLGVLPYLSEVCAALGDAPRAARLATLLARYAELVVPYSSSLCLGVGAHPLALLAETMGRLDEARAFAELAVARHATMDAPPWLARSRLLLARLLHRAGDDPQRARELAAAAQSGAAALGMRDVAAGAAELLAALDRSGAEPAAPRRGVFRREGALWMIGDDAAAPLRLRPCKGFGYIAALLRTPGRALAALDLAALDQRPADRALPASSPYERLTALRDQLDEAERFNDRERATHLRAELERRAALLAPSGRRRPGSTPAERARLNVTRTIADAVRRIAAADPALGRHFETTIRTGTLCSYVPDPRHPVDWQL